MGKRNFPPTFFQSFCLQFSLGSSSAHFQAAVCRSKSSLAGLISAAWLWCYEQALKAAVLKHSSSSTPRFFSILLATLGSCFPFPSSHEDSIYYIFFLREGKKKERKQKTDEKGKLQELILKKNPTNLTTAKRFLMKLWLGNIKESQTHFS